MTPITIPLNEIDVSLKKICGNKANSLSMLIEENISVPRGFCITTQAYREFIEKTGLKENIAMELGRKNISDMRWEEMWDASLRIKHAFLSKEIPLRIKSEIRESFQMFAKKTPLAVRSSSLMEDSSDFSFAGLHESFINVKDWKGLLKSIKIVFADFIRQLYIINLKLKFG